MRISFFLPISLVVLFGTATVAFPPAPYYTLFGTVRDQTGQVVRAEDAQVVLLKDAAEVARAGIKSGVLLKQNYEISAKIDHARAATSLYSTKAVPAQGQMSLVVEMGGLRYLPIEVSGTIPAGKGGERVRLDLTLGEDADRDGLPDAWEQWQLYQAGLFPGENGWDLTKLDKTGDFDGDGQSNFLEYLAGTFAGDASERFSMTIKSKEADAVNLEFFAITGKTYTIERSTDLKTWKAVPFAVGAAEAAQSHTADAVGVVAVKCEALPEHASAHYRLTVQ